MADIYGLFRPDGQNSVSAYLKSMSRVVDAHVPPDKHFFLPSTDCGLASTQSATCIADHDGLLVSVAGQPHWSDRQWRQVTADQGLAQAVASAFRRDGPRLLEQLHGPFALAVIDPTAGRLFLAVDRLGIYPLAWAQQARTLAFATHAEAIQVLPGLNRGLDQQSLFNYFYFHMVPSPGTIYAGTEKLLPGQYVDITGEGVERRFYWSVPYSESSRSTDDLAEELRALLAKAVASAADDAIPTGTFLSGGLDSSTVSGYFARMRDAEADAYGIGFDAQGYDEMDYARTAAKHFGLRLHEYYVTPEDVVEVLPKVAAAYDEPFGNASAIPAYFCARLAREDGKACLLGGDGGDEIFAGNARYAKQQVFGLYSHIPAALRRLVLEPVASHFPLGQRLPPVRKLRSYIAQAKMPMPERMESYNFLHRTDINTIFAAEFLQAIDPDYPLGNQREVYQRAATDSMVKRMLHLDLKITLADNDLRKVSRMCRLAGIDVRYPMLDEALVDFSALVPERKLVRPNKLRVFYKDALRDFLPPEILVKRKHGFGLPFGIWMATNKRLNELAKDSLVSLRKRGFIQPAYIDSLLDAHRSEHADYYGVMIWVMTMLEQWLTAHEH